MPQSQGGGDTSTLVTEPPVPGDQKVTDLTRENEELKRKIDVYKAESQNPKKRRVSTTPITLEDFEANHKDDGKDDEVQVLTVAQVHALLREAKQQPTKRKRK